MKRKEFEKFLKFCGIDSMAGRYKVLCVLEKVL